MPYNPTPLGIAVHQKPDEAHARLVSLFEKYKSRRRVAKHLRVSESTVGRWIEKLRARGYSDPRGSEAA